MPEILEIALTHERLDDGDPAERACFGRFTMETAAGFLTSGIDHYIDGYRGGPLISGYHAAEWFAANWWRLRYEPRSPAADWWRAHKMTAIGEGYVWPNITIFSDGVRTTLLSETSVRADTRPFRYLGAHPSVLPSTVFEAELDKFIGQMEGRLLDHGLRGTNLSLIVEELRAERDDPAVAERRRLEALLSRNPDEDADGAVDALIADAAVLGAESVQELAAEAGHGGVLLNRATLAALARNAGTPSHCGDTVSLHMDTPLERWSRVPPHVVGVKAAQALRQQQGLGDAPVGNKALAALLGAADCCLERSTDAPFSFSLDEPDGAGAIVLRSRYMEGRRFELARLLGDRLATRPDGALRAATRADTYRQKMQRSFAAELLSPFQGVEEYLGEDLSQDAQEDAAAHFQVSPRVILTLLVNHRRLGREQLGDDYEFAA